MTALSAHWQPTAEGLTGQWQLAGFAQVRSAVQALMDLADRLDHHPEVHFGYRHLTVIWITHDAGGITDKDWQAAAETDALLAAFRAD